jgi:hypothetical protein
MLKDIIVLIRRQQAIRQLELKMVVSVRELREGKTSLGL